MSQKISPVSQADSFSKRAWGTLLVLCGAIFLDALDASLMGVALPSIQHDLGMSTSSLQWVVSGYILGYGGFLLLGGRAADLLGRRRVFLISLGVFLLASGLGGLTNDGSLLIATRLIKGVAAAFTAPAGFSIITTTFAEGAARNKALAIYTATGAAGYSLGLVLGGLLTQVGWRLTFFMPVVVASITLIAGLRLVPKSDKSEQASGGFDVIGSVLITGAMLLLVFTLVEAPETGWLATRTVGSFAAAALLIASFIWRENHTSSPLIRLGILRSGSLVRANLTAMTLIGGWISFQFVLTLYLQQLRDWSALETGLGIFPSGLIVALVSPRIGTLVARFGVSKLITTGMALIATAYVLFLRIDLNSNYVFDMMPTFIIAGLGFALSFGPLNIAATNGIDAHEQGLVGGLLNTSFQFGGALILAITTATLEINTHGTDPASVLDGYRAAILVSLAAGIAGVVFSVLKSQRSSKITQTESIAIESVEQVA